MLKVIKGISSILIFILMMTVYVFADNYFPKFINLLLILLSIFEWRKYIQLKLISYFFSSCGVSLITLGIWIYSIYGSETLSWEIFCYAGGISFVIGYFLQCTKDSGIEDEIHNKSNIFERLIGRIPQDINIEEAQRNPTLTRRVGIAIGVFIILEGIITYFFPKYFGNNIIVNSVIILIGIVMILFTVIYGAPKNIHISPDV